MSRLRQVAALVAIALVVIAVGWTLARPGIPDAPHPEPTVESR